jgi:4-aminobutyrate aminotransferase-like enzyme
VDFVDNLIEVAMRKGLLSIRTQSGTLKIGPPLTIDDDALIEGINVLKESLKECLDILG